MNKHTGKRAAPAILLLSAMLFSTASGNRRQAAKKLSETAETGFGAFSQRSTRSIWSISFREMTLIRSVSSADIAALIRHAGRLVS